MNTLEVCSNCALAKSKQKNVKKVSYHLSSEIVGRINIDISGVQNSSYGGATYWLLIQDDFSGYLWSMFLSKKSGTPSAMLNWLKDTSKIFKTKTICLDNSGENKAFHDLIN